MSIAPKRRISFHRVPKLVDPVSQVLLDAVAIMEVQGQCSGTFQNSKGEVCALGAINLAVPDPMMRWMASERLARHLQSVEIIEMCGVDSVIYTWNDVTILRKNGPKIVRNEIRKAALKV